MADGRWKTSQMTGIGEIQIGNRQSAVGNFRYFVSLCAVCFRQNRQYLLSSRRSDDFLRFFVVL